MPRNVYIEANDDRKVIFVKYAERRPRQRYLAAQFDSRDGRWTMAGVIAWVANNPKLTLVEKDIKP